MFDWIWQTPVCWTGRWVRSASIRNMRFCSYALWALRDQWMIEDLAKQWGRLWSVTSSREIHRSSIPPKKQNPSSLPEIYKASNLFDYWLSHYSHSRVAVSSLKQACRGLQRLLLIQCWLGNTLYLCLPIRPAQAVPKCCPKSLAIDSASMIQELSY